MIQQVGVAHFDSAIEVARQFSIRARAHYSNDGKPVIEKNTADVAAEESARTCNRDCGCVFQYESVARAEQCATDQTSVAAGPIALMVPRIWLSNENRTFDRIGRFSRR